MRPSICHRLLSFAREVSIDHHGRWGARQRHGRRPSLRLCDRNQAHDPTNPTHRRIGCCDWRGRGRKWRCRNWSWVKSSIRSYLTRGLPSGLRCPFCSWVAHMTLRLAVAGEVATRRVPLTGGPLHRVRRLHTEPTGMSTVRVYGPHGRARRSVLHLAGLLIGSDKFGSHWFHDGGTGDGGTKKRPKCCKAKTAPCG